MDLALLASLRSVYNNMAFWLHCVFCVVAAQMGEFGDQSKSFSFAQTVLAHPVTAIVACLTFGVLLVVGIIYLKRIIENMREVEVLVKTKNFMAKEQKYLIGEKCEKIDVVH